MKRPAENRAAGEAIVVEAGDESSPFTIRIEIQPHAANWPAQATDDPYSRMLATERNANAIRRIFTPATQEAYRRLREYAKSRAPQAPLEPAPPAAMAAGGAVFH